LIWRAKENWNKQCEQAIDPEAAKTKSILAMKKNAAWASNFKEELISPSRPMIDPPIPEKLVKDNNLQMKFIST